MPLKRKDRRKKKHYSLEEVFAHVFQPAKDKKARNSTVIIDGEEIWPRTKKLIVLKRQWQKEGEVKCVRCGLRGKYFVMERFSKKSRWFFNLYGVRNGKEVLMNVDHIIPKSKGGGDGLNNSQVMCSICNNAKGNTMEKPKRRLTKVELEKELARLRSKLGEKESHLHNLKRDFANARGELDKERNDNRKLRKQLEILKGRVRQLAELLATPVAFYEKSGGKDIGS